MPELNQDGVVKVIGLMSGTSLDGVDAAVLETDGEAVARPGPALTRPYSAQERAILRMALETAREAAQDARPPEIAAAERVLTEAHIEAVEALLKENGLARGDIAYLGFHGQTVLHRPKERRTWQIGDAVGLARSSRIPVVNEFRLADVEAGGQGAPFVPLYHAVLTRSVKRPVAVVNIGGVANLTYVGEDGNLIAFDTGPGNAPIDDWALKNTGEPVDRDGRLARAGAVNESVLAAMLDNEFFAARPPKSLDRLDFVSDKMSRLSPQDGAATLTAFTAASIARACAHLPKAPFIWIVCGGGRHNPVLMDELKKRIDAKIVAAEDVGWRGDFLEAEAFAYLAARSVKGLPLSLPSTTGVPHPMPGGRLHKP